MIRYSTASENDIAEIAEYTTDRWGEVQADKYVADLSRCFEHIEKTPGLGRSFPEIHPALYRMEHHQHVVFYLPEPSGVFICRVLHNGC